MKAWRLTGPASVRPEIVWPKWALMSPLMTALFLRAGIYR